MIEKPPQTKNSTEKPKKPETPSEKPSGKSTAETAPGDNFGPAKEPSIDKTNRDTNEVGKEKGASPTGGKKQQASELSGGPAPGSDPFKNLREKYGPKKPSEQSQSKEQERGEQRKI
ncbi:MAG: hypothetical protein SAL07_07280 [Oscillatoria sp. PMC 1051.18]|nr:hypothetical protein [Oscillatoria sp. PMC 1050.18]MEC5029698.1 hypothetical protein [Oscillatoria sp. PMC 1051.18]